MKPRTGDQGMASVEALNPRDAGPRAVGGGWRAWTWPIVLLATLWAATHPYRGVIHDGRLYTLQAMNALDPTRFADDLYFKYGSQDSFSIFSRFYKLLVGALAPAQAHLIATLAGQALWFAALVLLMQALFARRVEAIAAVTASTVFVSLYGGLNVFHYGEAFATPRVFAEALVMLALMLVTRRRWIGAGFCIVVAAALHPIMALSGAAVLAVLAVLQDRRALALVVLGGVAGVGLALAHISPFDRLLLQFDDTWFQIVKERCGFGFITRWNTGDATVAASAAVSLATAHAIASPEQRRLILAVAIAGAGGVLVTLVGADLARDIFVVNIQPWRTLWLVSLLANAWTGAMLVRTPRAWISHDLLLATVALSLVSTVMGVLAPAPVVLRIVACGALIWERRRNASVPRWARVLALSLVGVAAVLFVPGLYGVQDLPGSTGAVLRLLIAAAAVVVLVHAATEGRRWLLAVAAPALALVAILAVDARSGWERFLEDQRTSPELAAFTASSGHLYWERGVEVMWFKLQRPSYYSCLQGTGAMFYRPTAVDYERRTAGLALLSNWDTSAPAGGICASRTLPLLPRLAADLAATCRALPDLDTLVLTQAVAGAPSRVWLAPAEQVFTEKGKTYRVARYYRYDCADIRPGSAMPAVAGGVG